MFLHKAIDLADWEAARFTVLQSHGNQTAEEDNMYNTGYINIFRWIFSVSSEKCVSVLTCRNKLAWEKTWAATPGLVEPGEVV